MPSKKGKLLKAAKAVKTMNRLKGGKRASRPGSRGSGADALRPATISSDDGDDQDADADVDDAASSRGGGSSEGVSPEASPSSSPSLLGTLPPAQELGAAAGGSAAATTTTTTTTTLERILEREGEIARHEMEVRALSNMKPNDRGTRKRPSRREREAEAAHLKQTELKLRSVESVATEKMFVMDGKIKDKVDLVARGAGGSDALFNFETKAGLTAAEYRREGNFEFYTASNLQKRQAFSHDRVVRKWIDIFWRTFSSVHATGRVGQAEYVQVHLNIAKALFDPEEWDEEDVRDMVEAEWHRETKETEAMAKDEFERSMFELVDKWSESIRLVEYRMFLQKLYYRITGPSQGKQAEKAKYEQRLRKLHREQRILNKDKQRYVDRISHLGAEAQRIAEKQAQGLAAKVSSLAQIHKLTAEIDARQDHISLLLAIEKETDEKRRRVLLSNARLSGLDVTPENVDELLDEEAKLSGAAEQKRSVHEDERDRLDAADRDYEARQRDLLARLETIESRSQETAAHLERLEVETDGLTRQRDLEVAAARDWQALANVETIAATAEGGADAVISLMRDDADFATLCRDNAIDLQTEVDVDVDVDEVASNDDLEESLNLRDRDASLKASLDELPSDDDDDDDDGGRGPDETSRPASRPSSSLGRAKDGAGASDHDFDGDRDFDEFEAAAARRRIKAAALLQASMSRASIDKRIDEDGTDHAPRDDGTSDACPPAADGAGGGPPPPGCPSGADDEADAHHNDHHHHHHHRPPADFRSWRGHRTWEVWRSMHRGVPAPTDVVAHLSPIHTTTTSKPYFFDAATALIETAKPVSKASEKRRLMGVRRRIIRDSDDDGGPASPSTAHALPAIPVRKASSLDSFALARPTHLTQTLNDLSPTAHAITPHLPEQQQQQQQQHHHHLLLPMGSSSPPSMAIVKGPARTSWTSSSPAFPSTTSPSTAVATAATRVSTSPVFAHGSRSATPSKKPPRTHFPPDVLLS